MDTVRQDYPRKRARLRRANDGFWTPGMGDPTPSTTASSTASIAPTHLSPFAAPSAHPSDAFFVDSLIRVRFPSEGPPRRLHARAAPDTVDNASPSVANRDAPRTQPRSAPAATDAAPRSRFSPQPPTANSSPRAKAVVGDSSSPYWSNAGGIFHPDAQNPTPVSSTEAQALQQFPNPIASQPLANAPTYAGISALVFDPTDAQPTLARNPATIVPSPSAALDRSLALSAVLRPSTASVVTRPVNPPTSLASAPSTVTETRSTIATSSSLLLTTALVTASHSSSPDSGSASSSIPSSFASSSAAAAAAASPSAAPTSFFSSLGSSPVNIAITVLVCVGIVALAIAFVFIFVRRCQRRRKKRRLGDLLGSEFGSPRVGGGGGGGSGPSEWATPGPGWTDKYYGEQVGGRMIGATGLGGGGGARTSSAGHGDDVEQWQREFEGIGIGEGGYGVARTLSQDHRRTSEWANYRAGGGGGARDSWDGGVDGDPAMFQQTHVLEYGSNGYATPVRPPPAAAIRARSEPDFSIDRLAPPLPAHASRPRATHQASYSSYASESMYPVDEIGDVEAEKKELSETMSALNLGGGGRSSPPGHDSAVTSPPAQTSWRDSLDWVMGSAADLIGSKLLARGTSADTLVASPPKKKLDQEDDDHDRFTARPASIRIPRGVLDPLSVSDQFTPLSPSYGDRFLDPARPSTAPAPPHPTSTLSRQSSMISFTSSAHFATTNQHGTFAQSARSRLFDAALAKHAQDEDELEILDDIAAAMMSRQTTTTTATTVPNDDGAPPVLPFPRFDHPTPPLALAPRRFVASPTAMTRASSTTTSSSFTDGTNPSPRSGGGDVGPPPPSHGMLRHDDDDEFGSASSIGSRTSFDAFGGRGRSTPRGESHERSSTSRRQRKRAPAMGIGQSSTSISTLDDDEYYVGRGRSRELEEKARELMVERRRRSEEFEASLV
ncbi:hypothetical protein JCM11491_006235 [Sporobolomyces phaffii]